MFAPQEVPRLSSRRIQFLQDMKRKDLLTALEKWRGLSVDEACNLAESYLVANIPEYERPWSRRNIPIMQRAFFSCLNIVQWGDCKCR